MADRLDLLLDVSRLIWRRWKGRHPTGIDRVCLAYLKHFGPRAQAVVQHDLFRRILSPNASQALFALLEAPSQRFRVKLLPTMVRHLRGLDRRGEGRFYLNVGHTGLDSPAYRHWLRKHDVKPIYLVHDLIPVTHPEFCRAGEEQRHRNRLRTVLSTAAGVVANSDATLSDLAQFARDEQLGMPPAIVAWLGVDRHPAVARKPATPKRPTFVVLGTIEGRKNHLLLLDVWSRLVERLGDKAPQLLIIGQRGWEAEEAFALLDRSSRLRGHVIEISDCSDEDLAAHLASARALLFPSMAEGFGLPLLEALGAGVPVLASDLPVFRELAGDIPTYLSPLDNPGWEEAILDFARPKSARRAAQLKRMKGFRPPDWSGHFAAVEDWLASLPQP